MAAKVLNIEAGKRITKVCVSERKGKAFSVSDSFVFNTPEGAVLDGQIISEISFGDKLKEELADRSINVSDCYFSVASSKIAAREVTLPNAKDEQIKSIVKTNASDYFPVDITKYVIDSVILEKTEDECRVLVVAMPAIIVDSYLALADYLGFVIKAVDFCSNSQYQILKGINSGDEDMADMFITIDPDSAAVIFSESGKLLLQRALSVGGDEMISKFMGKRDMELDEYLEALEILSNGDAASEEDEDEELYDCMTKLVSGITRSLDFFRGNVADKVVNRVVLMGSCCHLNGLKERIAEAVGVETVWLEEVPDIQGLANSISDISVYIGCLGSRLAPMSLLPEEYVTKHGGGGKAKAINDKNFGFFAVGICVGIAIILAAYSLGNYFVSKSDLEKIESDISKYEYAEQEFKTYLSYTDGDESLQTYVDGSVTNNSNLLAFFEELETKMPSSITFLSVSCNDEGVSINVTVPDFEAAAVTIRELRNFETIEIVTTSGMSQAADEEGVSQVSFSMSAKYVVPEEPTEPVVEEAATEEVID